MKTSSITMSDDNMLPVIVAIPNYNMGLELKRLLPTLDTAGYKEIIVLDDASTDESEAIVKSFSTLSTPLRFSKSIKNIGAGATRSRIIDELSYDAIIHFLDADMEVETPHIAAVISRSASKRRPFSFIGGLAKTPGNRQWIWNYGPLLTQTTPLAALTLTLIHSLDALTIKPSTFLRSKNWRLLARRPNPNTSPEAQTAGWVVEQNMVVDSRTFRELGGFDSSLREHEIQEFALRAHSRGFTGYFDPSFSACHRNIKVRKYNRFLEQERARRVIVKKYKNRT